MRCLLSWLRSPGESSVDGHSRGHPMRQPYLLDRVSKGAIRAESTRRRPNLDFAFEVIPLTHTSKIQAIGPKTRKNTPPKVRGIFLSS